MVLVAARQLTTVAKPEQQYKPEQQPQQFPTVQTTQWRRQYSNSQRRRREQSAWTARATRSSIRPDSIYQQTAKAVFNAGVAVVVAATNN
jgi:hypothetical protein